MAFLRLPRQVEIGIKALLELEYPQVLDLIDQLKIVRPALIPQKLAEKAAAELKDTDEQIITLIVLSIISLYGARQTRELSIEDFVEEVIHSVNKDGERIFQNAEGDSLKQRLTPLLNLEQSLGVTSKAFGVFADHERLFVNARILTDIRPIFQDDLSAVPIAAAAVHTLKIEYHEGPSHAHKEFYVALDSSDIVELKKLIEREEAKAKIMKSMLSSLGVRDLEE